MLTREQLLAGFTGPIRPVHTPFLYRVGLAVVCFTMVLLPLVYLALIALAGWGVWWHATHNTGIIGGRGRAGLGSVLVYVTPIVAGAVLVAFLIKPLFAPRAKPPVRVGLTPSSEPLVFELVRKLCSVVGAPEPRRIEIDTLVNASASFRRGFLSFFGHDLLLTIGLPLAAGVSLRNLVGVLAHEFGHFAQGSGMRATYLVRTINAWFARVVYERDAWDAALEAWSKGVDLRIGIVLYAVRFFVWLTRRLLWVLMMAGHAVSMFMLREMEYDADQYEVRVAGTESFVKTARALPVLNASHAAALEALRESWNERRLGDDLARLVVAEHSRIPEQARKEFLDEHFKGKGSLFDTHPPDLRRIERAKAAPDPGVFTLDVPATELFRDFDGLSRRATADFYREVLGDEFSDKYLVRSEALVDQAGAARSEQEGLGRYFGHAVTADLPLFVADDAAQPPADPGALRRELAAAREESLRGLEATKSAAAPLGQAEDRLRLLARLERVAHAGLKFKAADFELKSADLAGISAARRPVQISRDGLVKHLAPVRESLARRLSAGLRLSADRTLGPLLAAQSALRDAHPELRALFDDFLSLGLLLQSIEGNEEHEGLIGQLRAGASRWTKALALIRARLSTAPYPFEHAQAGISLGEFLIPALPDADDFGAVMSALQGLGERYFGLYARLMGRLVAAAEAVEAAGPP